MGAVCRLKSRVRIVPTFCNWWLISMLFSVFRWCENVQCVLICVWRFAVQNGEGWSDRNEDRAKDGDHER